MAVMVQKLLTLDCFFIDASDLCASLATNMVEMHSLYRTEKY